jgi:HEAT repeat protein
MSSSKTLIALFAVLCGALNVVAQKPSDSRSQYPSQDAKPPIPREIGGKTFAQWKQDLYHADPSVRANAITVIPGFREDAMEAVPRLVELTADRDASPRVKSVLALKFMGIKGTDRQRVVKALGERITHDTQAIVRYEAAQALIRFGADGREVVGDLVKGIGDTSTWELRHACILALIVAGVDETKGPDPRVTDALLLRINNFYEPTFQVRLEAIIALGALGRPQDPKKLQQVVAGLKQNFNSSNKAIKIWSHVSLMALEDKVNNKDLDTIAGYLTDPERDVRVQAVTALGALQGKAHDYLPKIFDMLRREKEPQVQEAVCNALGRMGDKSDKVLQNLIRMTESDSLETVPVVLAACRAFAQLGTPTAEVMDAMNKVQEHRAMNPQQKDLVRKYMEEAKKPKETEKKPKEKEKVKGEIANPKRGNR